MDQDEVLRILREVGAVLNGHFVLTSGKHSEVYVNKDALYPYTGKTGRLCEMIAKHFEQDGVQTVIGPAMGGVILSQWTAYHLDWILGRDVSAVYAEKVGNGDAFTISRGYDELIPGRKVLVVEDVLTTGGSAKKVVEVVRQLGGNVVGVGVLCNRGGVTFHDVGDVPKLFALCTITLNTWAREECPLCSQGVPIKHGRWQGARVPAPETGIST
ncbi:MAG: phosphoribosyltransferase family protein [bacterium]|nr:phosphoribosyltransferase family protein [bacterium]